MPDPQVQQQVPPIDSPSAATTVPVPAGLVLAPMRALRFDVTAAGGELADLLSPPYDVLDDAGVMRLEERDPHNVVRLILPRDTDGPGTRYAGAAALLASWRAEGVLAADDVPALYVYEEAEPGGHVQRGFLGAVGLAHPDAGIVLPHENTMAGPVADRLALLTATATDLEPIFLVYDGGGAASAAVAAADGSAPLAEATTDDGIRHRLWALRDPALLTAVAADLLPRRAVIADGHHRFATYLQHQAQQHAAGAGAGPWDYGLTLLVDATAFGPQVHPIHRVVPGLPLDGAVEGAAAGFTVVELPALVGGDLEPALAALAEAGRDGTALLLTDGDHAHLLTGPDGGRLADVLDAERSAAWRSLDVTVAHRLLIDVLWGLEDREDVVDFAHDVTAAVAAARATGGTAMLLNPTPVEAVLAVAAAGERMPRKSTLFTPKPRTGLVLRAHSDGAR